MSDAAPEPGGRVEPRGRRLLRVASRIAAVAVAIVILDVLGIDVTGWLSDLWDRITSVPTEYVVAGVITQTGQTSLAGLSYYGILQAAYPGQVKLAPVVTAYAVGVALNGFLPANIGTIVTLVMFAAVIPSATVGGAAAAYLVQKIFFTLVGAVIYLYLFFSVPGTFDVNLGNISAHPVVSIAVVGAGVVLLAAGGRLFWRKVEKLWQHTRQGGVILARPRVYFMDAFVPSLGSWLCKCVVIAIFLAAFAIPVTIDSIVWIIGSGSLANVASFTPGSVGVTQATNALALASCCDVVRSTTVAYSTAQQLVVTAWNIAFAIVLVVVVFGWTGGRQIVSSALADAEEREREKHASRARHSGEG